MTNVQLWIGVAVPSVLIVLAWIQSNVRSGRTEKQLDDLAARVDAGFSAVSTRVGAIEHDLREFYRISGKLEGRLDTIERR